MPIAKIFHSATQNYDLDLIFRLSSSSHFIEISKAILANSISSSLRGGNAGTFPHKIRYIVVESWACLPEVYSFGEESDNKEMFRKKFKRLISHTDVDLTSQNILIFLDQRP